MAESVVLIGIPEIAEIAGVTRSAVSNWRKRYNDFPEPRVQTDSGLLFDHSAVEAWLLERGKLDGPVPPGALVWQFADALRGDWNAEQFAEFLSSWLVYLEACERGRKQGRSVDQPDIEMPPEHTWDEVQRASDKELPARLRRAAGFIEAQNPVLAGLLDGLTPQPLPDIARLRAFVAQLEGAAARDGSSRIGLLDQAERHVLALDRFSGEFDTPESMAYLMSRLAGTVTGSGVVVDPALGSGGLLLMWAVTETRPSGPVELLGVDLNEAIARHARARFFIYGVDARVLCADALRVTPAEWPHADVVVLDPPMGLGNWGDPGLYRDDRWVFGAPPPRNADLAWVQLCVSMLKPTGRAVIALPIGSLTSGGVEAKIRQSLIDAGAIEAIVELPARLRRNTSIPIALWLLRAPAARASASELLLVDASRLGTSGRSEHELNPEDIERIVETVDRWREGDDIIAEQDTGSEDMFHLAIDTAKIIDANLSPRRYKPIMKPDLASLRDESDRLYTELRDDLSNLLNAVGPVLDDAATTGDTVAPELRGLDGAPQMFTESWSIQRRVRLGDIADVRVVTPNSPEASAEMPRGDLFIRFGAEGISVHTSLDARSRDSQTGRVIVVHRRDDQPAEMGRWLGLWAKSRGLAELLDRHARGTTVRSVSLRDIAEFSVPVPSRDRLYSAINRIDQFADATDMALFLHETLRELFEAECRLAFAEAVEE